MHECRGFVVVCQCLLWYEALCQTKRCIALGFTQIQTLAYAIGGHICITHAAQYLLRFLYSRFLLVLKSRFLAKTGVDDARLSNGMQDLSGNNRAPRHRCEG